MMPAWFYASMHNRVRPDRGGLFYVCTRPFETLSHIKLDSLPESRYNEICYEIFLFSYLIGEGTT